MSSRRRRQVNDDEEDEDEDTAEMSSDYSDGEEGVEEGNYADHENGQEQGHSIEQGSEVASEHLTDGEEGEPLPEIGDGEGEGDVVEDVLGSEGDSEGLSQAGAEEDENERKARVAEMNRRKKDPTYVPTQGPYYSHDDRRGASKNSTVRPGERTLVDVGRSGQVEMDDGPWRHDKFEELLGEDDDGEKGRPSRTFEGSWGSKGRGRGRGRFDRGRGGRLGGRSDRDRQFRGRYEDRRDDSMGGGRGKDRGRGRLTQPSHSYTEPEDEQSYLPRGKQSAYQKGVEMETFSGTDQVGDNNDPSQSLNHRSAKRHSKTASSRAEKRTAGNERPLTALPLTSASVEGHEGREEREYGRVRQREDRKRRPIINRDALSAITAKSRPADESGRGKGGREAYNRGLGGRDGRGMGRKGGGAFGREGRGRGYHAEIESGDGSEHSIADDPQTNHGNHIEIPIPHPAPPAYRPSAQSPAPASPPQQVVPYQPYPQNNMRAGGRNGLRRLNQSRPPPLQTSHSRPEDRPPYPRTHTSSQAPLPLTPPMGRIRTRSGGGLNPAAAPVVPPSAMHAPYSNGTHPPSEYPPEPTVPYTYPDASQQTQTLPGPPSRPQISPPSTEHRTHSVGGDLWYPPPEHHVPPPDYAPPEYHEADYPRESYRTRPPPPPGFYPPQESYMQTPEDGRAVYLSLPEDHEERNPAGMIVMEAMSHPEASTHAKAHDAYVHAVSGPGGRKGLKALSAAAAAFRPKRDGEDTEPAGQTEGEDLLWG